jgi:hypothetical protein
MNDQLAIGVPLAYMPVIVRPEPHGRFTAEPLGTPELRVVADSSEEALEQVRIALLSWSGSLHWVAMPGTTGSTSAMEQWAGHAKEDPDFDSYVEEIRRYRQEVDDRECPASSSTPTI